MAEDGKPAIDEFDRLLGSLERRNGDNTAGRSRCSAEPRCSVPRFRNKPDQPVVDRGYRQGLPVRDRGASASPVVRAAGQRFAIDVELPAHGVVAAHDLDVSREGVQHCRVLRLLERVDHIRQVR